MQKVKKSVTEGGGFVRLTENTDPRVVEQNNPGATCQLKSTVGDRSLFREPSHGRYIAGHEPPKTPVVDGLGLWSWMFPPPPSPGEHGAYEPK